MRLLVIALTGLALVISASAVEPKPGAKGTNKKKPVASAKKAPSKAPAKKVASSKAPAKRPAGALNASIASAPKKSPSSKRYSKTKVVARRLPKPTPVSKQVRTQAVSYVSTEVEDAASIPVENSAALIPFFEQLYRGQRGETEGPVRILHYGDSHTAADEWTGDMRVRFQAKFGDGGSGYSYAGRPWNSYRRLDVRTGSTKNWHSDGLVGRSGDGLYGLGGVSMSTNVPRESVYLQADCQQIELFYLQQPGGGALQLYDNGSAVDRVSTEGELAPGYFRYTTTPGPHRFEFETIEKAPVRLFGISAENARGVTYETLGINGAQASIVLDWDQALLASNVTHRNPALIVLAYGTNEAGRRDWTKETYRAMFSQLIQRFRAAAPAATILVIGPPDRFVRNRGKWAPMESISMIVEAQREAAIANRCPFWDMRAKMGGMGSMQQWVLAGMAQYDYVHFTSPGYRLLGDAIFRDLMNQYGEFLKARESIASVPAPTVPVGAAAKATAAEIAVPQAQQ